MNNSEISYRWQEVTLGKLVDSGQLLIRNGFAQGGYNEDGKGVPHLRPFNIDTEGNLSLAQIKSVEPPATDSPYWLQLGDVLFNNTNTQELVGKTTYFNVSGRYTLSNHMTILRVLDDTSINAEWLARRLHHMWSTGYFETICRRHVNQASIGLERLKGVSFLLPPSDQQTAIAYALRAISKAKTTREREAELIGELFREALADFMTGKLSVSPLLEGGERP